MDSVYRFAPCHSDGPCAAVVKSTNNDTRDTVRDRQRQTDRQRQRDRDRETLRETETD